MILVEAKYSKTQLIIFAASWSDLEQYGCQKTAENLELFFKRAIQFTAKTLILEIYPISIKNWDIFFRIGINIEPYCLMLNNFDLFDKIFWH